MIPPDRRRKSVDRSVSRYTSAVLQGSSPCRADGSAATQSENYRDAAERMALRADQVRRVIMAAGVPLVQFIPYRNFGMHLDKLTRRHSGTTLVRLALAAFEYWTAYGLRQEVLSAISARMFGLVLPSAGGRQQQSSR
jgi:hypothetical protein